MKTIKKPLISWLTGIIMFVCSCNSNQLKECTTELEFYPETHQEKPELPSPCIMDDGTEIITIQTSENEFAIVPVTVENGDPRNYIEGQWGKGNQLELGCADFPVLEKTGLHSQEELLNTKFITGKSVDGISEEARPGQSSFEGFIAENEDIISVLNADNQLVRQLGFSHQELASPLFHIFNLILEHRTHFIERRRIFGDVKSVYYNGNPLNVTWGGAKGFQTSIFNDGNLGYYWIKIRREPNNDELSYLKTHYSDLDESEFQKLIDKLSAINTGEMVPYYIMHYGFYEGHTGYRADPVSVAFIFGLKTLPEIDKKLSHKLPQFFRI